MSNFKVDISNLDRIIKKTVEAINDSKSELYDIAESARSECKKIELELNELKKLAHETIEKVSSLEVELKESKKELMLVSKNYDKYTEAQIKKAYEIADSLRMDLLIKKEQEQYYIRRRNDLEIRLKEAYKTVKKADNLISNIGVSLGYLTGDLNDVSEQLENIQHRQMLGIKVIKAQEEERQRVARDIHDGPAQSMSNIVLKAEICERLVETEPDKVKSELQLLKSVVRETLQDIRRIIYNLRPMSLDDLGLIPTLQRYITTYQEESGTMVYFKTTGVFEDIKPMISLTVFRLVQEAINNIKKYAHANSVTINLEVINNKLRLVIFDDGRGFDTSILSIDSDNMDSGFGIFSMRERVELLDGKFEIQSNLGNGTRLNIFVPLITEEEVSNG